MNSSQSIVPENFNVPPIVDVPSTTNICEQSEQIDVVPSSNICDDNCETNEMDEVPFEWVSGFSKNPRIPGRAIVKGNSKYIFNKITGRVLYNITVLPKNIKNARQSVHFLKKMERGILLSMI